MMAMFDQSIVNDETVSLHLRETADRVCCKGGVFVTSTIHLKYWLLQASKEVS